MLLDESETDQLQVHQNELGNEFSVFDLDFVVWIFGLITFLVLASMNWDLDSFALTGGAVPVQEAQDVMVPTSAGWKEWVFPGGIH